MGRIGGRSLSVEQVRTGYIARFLGFSGLLGHLASREAFGKHFERTKHGRKQYEYPKYRQTIMTRSEASTCSPSFGPPM